MSNPIDPALRGLVPNEPQGPRRGAGVGPASTDRPDSTGAPAERGPAFQALLEELQAKAQRLEDTSRSVERPEDLAEAVGRAEDSLAAALSFGDQLLEAYREQLQRAPHASPAEASPADGTPDSEEPA